MSIRPIGDRIAVKPVAVEEKTKSGIVLPGSAQEKPHQGEVVAVGSGYVSQATGQRIPLEVKVGDKVVYGKHAGIDVKFDGEELILLTENDILVVLE
ncbi:MAG: co-chaperone GroES [Peptococcaceae bacterium]|jgi:chaperonin GroES|nr:co-chaperone GroES [Peptococcaceae bacterium]MBQ2014006.1 co-chaperone GroES [Peptococcaceae bacterium]MBQ2035605.1 co-chaperone GroES [Peptococcaceae bacterium]MBQ2119591.1 co-chaperone GroES [Peptococcaceae bacterium]MBQ2448833.1 co-chaperone GroES [Peptococcaceae bacterium]